MSSSIAANGIARALHVAIDDVGICVELSDGRTISAPLAWYPRLVHGSREERASWTLIGAGHGIHWPELDEDISIDNLLMGRPSSESRQSFAKWLESRPKPTHG